MSLRLPVLLSALAALIFMPTAVRADKVSTEQLRAAVGRGDALPLSDLKRRLSATYPGEIIKVDVDMDDGRLRYEFKVLQASGRVLEVTMDAATGRFLEVEND
ncbi:MAG: PepSY domain-containing protein [Methylobacterium mesophilicum]|nr:PepSY domain-containing protein [Methylobacterium mesophilicum]